MPASRRARAMIFAPRSCPSRPGLATTTRILCPEASMAAGSLEDGRLGVGAEHLLQRQHDLALARMRAGAVEQRLHQVRLALGGLLERGERSLHVLAPTARA